MVPCHASQGGACTDGSSSTGSADASALFPGLSTSMLHSERAEVGAMLGLDVGAGGAAGSA